MTLEEAYQKYGELTIQAEILQSQIMNVKKFIVEQINAKNATKKTEEPVV